MTLRYFTFISLSACCTMSLKPPTPLRILFSDMIMQFSENIFHNHSIGPKIHQILKKTKCKIGRIICVACTYHLCWVS